MLLQTFQAVFDELANDIFLGQISFGCSQYIWWEFSSRHLTTSQRPQWPIARFVAIPCVICLPTVYQGCPQNLLEMEPKPCDDV
jgi:hypothetical protein